LKPVFVDTGAFYALADRKDPAHGPAKEFYASSRLSFLTTDFIFAETMSLLTKRLGKKAAVRFGAALRGSKRIQIEEPAFELREASWELFSKQLDKEYDLIDCISFKLMEAYGIEKVFGFDRHFVQYGFQLVPERLSQ
jgi:predicted nucleic acid-binding protein